MGGEDTPYADRRNADGWPLKDPGIVQADFIGNHGFAGIVPEESGPRHTLTAETLTAGR